MTYIFTAFMLMYAYVFPIYSAPRGGWREKKEISVAVVTNICHETIE
jgi:hypothetical protein